MARTRKPDARVLIEGHFTPRFASCLHLIQAATPNAGKSLNYLLGEAINDLCAKYGVVRRSLSSDQRHYQAAPGSLRILTADAPGYASLEPKVCEICGKSFLRIVGRQDEKTCSACELRLTEETRVHERSLASAKRDVPKSNGGRESKKSVDPDPSSFSSTPVRHDRIMRAVHQHVTEDRHDRRRTAAIANGIR